MQPSVINFVAPWRGPLIWLCAALALAALIFTTLELWKARTANDTIRALISHKDVQIDPIRAPSQVVLARINESISRDHLDEAQTVLGSAGTQLEPRQRALALYNLANERTRQGAEFARKGDLDHAAALINVAKSEYRLTLKSDPYDWNAKFNLDVAMRIVRDLPQAENLPDNEKETPKRVWTDLPGIPKGLP